MANSSHGPQDSWKSQSADRVDGSGQKQSDLIRAMESLRSRLIETVRNGRFDPETAIESECELHKAVQLAQKPFPEKNKILAYLSLTQALLSNNPSAANLLVELNQVKALVQQS